MLICPQTGLKVLRVWGFNDVTATPSSGTVWFQSFITGASPVINTGADGLQRLDYVVSSAAAHGVSLIINFVNNWSDYGGMDVYVKQILNSPDHDLFYTNAAVIVSTTFMNVAIFSPLMRCQIFRPLSRTMLARS